jgi:uncharacterized protein YjbI with pentapeptide repeats
VPKNKQRGGHIRHKPRRIDAAPQQISHTSVDLDRAQGAVVDAAAVSGGLWLSYLFVLFYFLVAAASVTHRDLFLENPVRLPFLAIDLPLRAFFWLGPILFLIVHTYVLVHFVLLAQKIRFLDAALHEFVASPEKRGSIRRQLPSNTFVQVLAGPREVRNGFLGILLWLIAVISLAIGPVILLLFFLLQALPYHDTWVVWWQRANLILDLVLLWVLWPSIFPASSISKFRRRLRTGFIAASNGIAISFALMIATFPGELFYQIGSQVPLRPILITSNYEPDTLRPSAPWADRLLLPGIDVIDHVRFDEERKIAESRETLSFRGRHLEGAVLFDAVLKRVNFSGAHLENAILTRAQLQGAKFSDATLRGASLAYASIQGSDMTRADLAGADLVGAGLQGAILFKANIVAADLTFAELTAADVSEAALQGTDLSGTDLRGANLLLVGLQGSDLNGAVLDGVTFEGACVWRAEMTEAFQLSDGIRADRLTFSPDEKNTFSSEVDCQLVTYEKLLARYQEADIVERLWKLQPSAEVEDIEDNWRGLQTSNVHMHFAVRDAMVEDAGCAPGNAPYVMMGIVAGQKWDSNQGQSAVAQRFLEASCEGSRGLPEDVKAIILHTARQTN